MGKAGCRAKEVDPLDEAAVEDKTVLKAGEIR